METESSFVAPEGVYTVTEEHKHSLLGVHTVNAVPVTYPTRLKTVTVKFTMDTTEIIKKSALVNVTVLSELSLYLI